MTIPEKADILRSMGGMHITRQKEHFSLAYVRALASAAGYAVQPIENDDFGVDLEIRDGAMRIDVQMKCTSDGGDGNTIPFDLDARTFNLLSDENRILPAYLFLVEVHEEPVRWIECEANAIRLSRCGYYHRMKPAVSTSNSTTKRIHIERDNRLTVDSLDRIMKEVRG